MHRRAFTAVETLVAIALLLLLSSAIAAFLWDVQQQRERIGRLSEERLVGALVIDALEEAARTAVTRGPEGAGFVGDEASLRIESRRITIETATPTASALAPDRVLGVTWDENSGALSLNGDALTERLRRLVLRYHDGNGWVESYDASAVGGLPVAIEIAMWFGSPEETLVESTPADLVELGEGFGLPTPADLREARGPVLWGEPDRRRVIAIPRLRHEEGA